MGLFTGIEIKQRTFSTAPRLDVISVILPMLKQPAQERWMRAVILFPYREKKMLSLSSVHLLKFNLQKKIHRLGGVRVSRIIEDPAEPRLVYNPDHPDADEEGYVRMPNVNVLTEMVDLISATRSYEANVTTLNATKEMFLRALEIGRG